MNHDDELEKHTFKQETVDVKPLKQSRVTHKKVLEETPGQVMRRSLAVENSKTVDPLMSAGIQDLKSNDVLAYRRDGVQHGVYKKLRMGHYQIDACLDLHLPDINCLYWMSIVGEFVLPTNNSLQSQSYLQ